MTAKEATSAYRLQQWTGLVCECKASGKTVTAWCAEQGIATKTYYYWQRRVRQAACEQLTLKEATGLPMTMTNGGPAFSEYRQPNRRENSAAVTLHLSGATVEIHNGADVSVIEGTLKALKSIC